MLKHIFKPCIHKAVASIAVATLAGLGACTTSGTISEPSQNFNSRVSIIVIHHTTADFDDSLRSETADIKQCSTDGHGDHILAARFLNRFVPASIPWIHIDLSAGQHKGGLAHIPTEITGFGVRFTLELLRHQFASPGELAEQLST